MALRVTCPKIFMFKNQTLKADEVKHFIIPIDFRSIEGSLLPLGNTKFIKNASLNYYHFY